MIALVVAILVTPLDQPPTPALRAATTFVAVVVATVTVVIVVVGIAVTLRARPRRLKVGLPPTTSTTATPRLRPCGLLIALVSCSGGTVCGQGAAICVAAGLLLARTSRTRTGRAHTGRAQRRRGRDAAAVRRWRGQPRQRGERDRLCNRRRRGGPRQGGGGGGRSRIGSGGISAHNQARFAHGSRAEHESESAACKWHRRRVRGGRGRQAPREERDGRRHVHGRRRH